MTPITKQILANDMLKHVPSLNDIDVVVAQVDDSYHTMRIFRGQPANLRYEISSDEAEYLCGAVADGAGLGELNALHDRYDEITRSKQPRNTFAGYDA